MHKGHLDEETFTLASRPNLRETLMNGLPKVGSFILAEIESPLYFKNKMGGFLANKAKVNNFVTRLASH